MKNNTSYEWKVKKSGPVYKTIIVTKDCSSMFPKPKKGSGFFKLSFNNQEYSVFIMKPIENNYCIKGEFGSLRKLYQDIGILTNKYYKINGILKITKEENIYVVKYDPAGEEIIFF